MSVDLACSRECGGVALAVIVIAGLAVLSHLTRLLPHLIAKWRTKGPR